MATLSEDRYSSVAMDLLRDSRRHVHVNRAGFFANKPGIAADYTYGDRLLRYSWQKANKQASTEWFDFKRPDDAQLLAYAHALLHEMGHAMDDGVTSYLRSQQLKQGWSMVGAYLQRHPEQGMDSSDVTSKIEPAPTKDIMDTYAMLDLQNMGYQVITVADKPAPNGLHFQLSPTEKDAQGRLIVYFYPEQ